MSRFSERHGYHRPAPPRTQLEVAPEDLRAVLHSMLVDDPGALGAYQIVCRTLNRVPDPDIWSNQGAREPLLYLLRKLEWYEVFDLLEERASPTDVHEVNASFTRTGLAYEMVSNVPQGGQISLYDPESDELQVAGAEHEAVEVLAGKFAPVRQQYERALGALHSRPADPEKAISESLGAVEAVTRLLAGGKDFGANIDSLFAQSPPWAKALAASLKALYGYGSQVPGARHGRYTDPMLEIEDALYVARTCGAAIALLTAGDRQQRWP